MEWFQGPISDHAVFWFGIKVFWWKRLILIIQMILGFSILLTLVTAEQKRKLSDAWQQRKLNAEGVVVPPVIKVRTLIKWFGLAVISFATGLAYLTHELVLQNHQPVPFWPAWFFWAFVLAMLSIPFAEIIVALSMLRTGVRTVQRHMPKLLAWFLNHEKFDRNVTVAICVALFLVTTLQIVLS